MRYEVTTQDVPDEPILSVRDRVAMSRLPGFIGQSYQALYGRLGELGVPATGAPFVIYHAFGPGEVDAEVCVPLAYQVAGSAAMVSRVLLAGLVARTLHLGAYDGLGAAYTELTEWIGDHGFEATGAARERYLNQPGPGVARADCVTEIDIPITAARVPVGAA
jgi:effector-binding domain-containing protein